MYVQLPLDIRLRASATFDSFIAGPNAEAVDYLRTRQDSGQNIYLWGGAGTGKTHLLQAACHAMSSSGGTAVYLPLERMGEFLPEIMDGLDALTLICIDDIHMIAGRKDWESALFRLFNAVRERSGRLVFTGAKSPRGLGLALPDLGTRLAWGLVFQLQPLSDEQLTLALGARAQALGMDLPEEVARYLMQRCVRDISALFLLLERLERAALSAQRRLTVPFVKGVIEE